ncbi:MAG: hypothetical protein H6742_04950 [Alphaproteobacteria bacterium]|nr:hypothetical protein [Alphaproteobacteria bacterium]
MAGIDRERGIGARAEGRSLRRAGVLGLVLAGGCTGGKDEATAPTGRYSAVGGLDRAGEWLYVVGGGDADGILQDAWRLQVATGTWEPLSEPPLPMLRGTATPDGSDGLVVFGGEGPGYEDLSRLWRWDLAADAWEEVADEGPSVRKKHAATWVDGALWMSGGEHNDDDPDVIRDDAWRWVDGAGWSLVEEGAGPGAAYRHGLAWDVEHQRLWHHAGYDATDTRVDWLWSREADDSWVQWSFTDGAPKRASHAFYVAPDGACGLSGPTPFAWGGHATDQDLWCFDAATSSWVGLPPPGEAPLPRDAMVTDLAPDGRTLVLACGDPASEDVPDFVCDAWTLDVVTGAWTELVPIE